MFSSPLSMISTHIIRTTIIESPEFSQEVKEWGHPSFRLGFGAEMAIRAWWVLNKDAHYGAIIPVPAA